MSEYKYYRTVLKKLDVTVSTYSNSNQDALLDALKSIDATNLKIDLESTGAISFDISVDDAANDAKARREADNAADEAAREQEEAARDAKGDANLDAVEGEQVSAAAE